jgi:hypothetical protein
LRLIESKIQTITAGNGALYSCRSSDYPYFNPRKGHDSALPTYFAKKGKKCLYNQNAIAYEKAGENLQDEFKRKVRMSRNILSSLLPKLWLLNFMKLKWFSYFYFGHRLLRKRLWLYHVLILYSSIHLFFIINQDYLPLTILIIAFQFIFYFIGFTCLFIPNLNRKNHIFKLLRFIMYYDLTVFSQLVAVFKQISSKSKPFWEKA